MLLRPPAFVFVAFSACLLGACSGDSGAQAAAGSEASEASADGELDPVSALRKACADLAARPEHTEPEVTVAHILVSFKGAPRMTATRTPEEAEELVAELLVRIEAGEDFETLRKQFSEDPGPPTYVMTLGPATPPALSRGQMVKAFGNVGWRLEVGQVGVAPRHDADSPYGWHIVKRLQ